MFTKHVSDLEYSDIVYLVNIQKEPEGYHLDYKGEIGHPDKSKKELSKDISSFGNTDGGYLIIGVEEKKHIITGIEPNILSKPIDEWLNQVLSTNIDPPMFYYDPKVIPIPESDKVIVVIHVPESLKKPHMVSETHQYYIRINKSSVPTTHNQIKEMFESSRRRYDEYQDFLHRKHIFDEEDPNFGLNINSKSLYYEFPEYLEIHGLSNPLLLFSIIPKFPNEERITQTFPELKQWLGENSRGFEPDKQKQIFFPNGGYDLKMDGIVFKNYSGDRIRSYFEILNNGYIEVGFLSSVFSRDKVDDKLFPCMMLTDIIGFELQLLGFSKKFFDFIKYFDDVEIRLCFVNVLDYKLEGFRGDNDFNYKRNDRRNKHHKNLIISHRFNPNTVTDEEILMIGKTFSEKICRGFGLERDYCFNDKGEIDNHYYSHFRI